MKPLLLVIGLALVGTFVWKNTQHPAPGGDERPTDPVRAMERAVAEFPHADVSYNVTKTESLVSPIVGTITDELNYGVHYQYQFHWREQRWVFNRMVCTENGKDLTFALPDHGPEIRTFLAKYGYHVPSPERELAAATPVPKPYMEANGLTVRVGNNTYLEKPLPLPRATPTVAEQNAEIARKYGAAGK